MLSQAVLETIRDLMNVAAVGKVSISSMLTHTQSVKCLLAMSSLHISSSSHFTYALHRATPQAVPQWLHDIFLGYGDPAAAVFTNLRAKSKAAAHSSMRDAMEVEGGADQV